MALSTKTEPVLLANLVPTILTALVAVATAFDWWNPTDEQVGALAGIASAVLVAATAFARQKVTPVERVDALVTTLAAEQGAVIADLKTDLSVAEAEAQGAKVEIEKAQGDAALAREQAAQAAQAPPALPLNWNMLPLPTISADIPPIPPEFLPSADPASVRPAVGLVGGVGGPGPDGANT